MMIRVDDLAGGVLLRLMIWDFQGDFMPPLVTGELNLPF